MLFAFLLVLPFQAAFHQLSDFQKDVYAGALLSSAAAIALLIAPVVVSPHQLPAADEGSHRSGWANGLLIAGMGFIVLGITLSVALVLDLVLGSCRHDPAERASTGAWFAWFWFGVPLLRRRGFEHSDT